MENYPEHIELERMRCYKYLGVQISEDLTWPTHIQGVIKKAIQRLYHLRQLRRFGAPPSILRAFYTGTVESILTQSIASWFSNSSEQDRKALKRVVRAAERCCKSALPSLQETYEKRCRAVRILKDLEIRQEVQEHCSEDRETEKKFLSTSCQAPESEHAMSISLSF